jgi:hypothetical protein
VRPVDNDEMMAAVESHELLVRHFDGREVLLREIDWSRLITRTVEEEKRNFEGRNDRSGRGAVGEAAVRASGAEPDRRVLHAASGAGGRP